MLRLTVPRLVEEELVGALGPASLGVETTAIEDGRIRVAFYTVTHEQAEALAETVRRLHPGAGEWDLSTGVLEDGRWVEAWIAGLRPFPLGKRFLVVPGDETPPLGDRFAIRLVPGRAFGTGEHATTRLCVAGLEERLVPGQDWVDLGCGTAILSMVAAHLGAGSVLGLDNDPEAVVVAGEVLAANGMKDRVRVRVGSVSDLAPGSADGIVANIAGRFFERRAAELARVLRRPGFLIVSGFLVEDRPNLRQVFASAGLECVVESEDGPWGLLVARRGT